MVINNHWIRLEIDTERILMDGLVVSNDIFPKKKKSRGGRGKTTTGHTTAQHSTAQHSPRSKFWNLSSNEFLANLEISWSPKMNKNICQQRLFFSGLSLHLFLSHPQHYQDWLGRGARPAWQNWKSWWSLQLQQSPLLHLIIALEIKSYSWTEENHSWGRGVFLNWQGSWLSWRSGIKDQQLLSCEEQRRWGGAPYSERYCEASFTGRRRRRMRRETCSPPTDLKSHFEIK